MSLEAMKMVLATLEDIFGKNKVDVVAINALRQAIEQAEKPEPVGWFVQYEDSHEFVWRKPDRWRVKQALEIQPLYTAPPKREWVGLTDEEVNALLWKMSLGAVEEDVRTIETKLKEKNT